MEKSVDKKVWVFNIERFAIHDGPGIRTCVFLQGCPLRCQWCANPESQVRGVQLLHLDTKCSGCGRCAKECPNRAIVIQDGKAVFDRGKCTRCGVCVKACLQQANQLSGKQMSLDEIRETVMRDADYYKTSGGGVTFSGGEAMAYAGELLELVQKLKESGISVAVETCGQTAWDQFKVLLPYVDIFLYDLKSLHSNVLKQYTGGDVKVITHNLERLAESCGEKIVLRIPVIPGVNFSKEDIEEMLCYARKLGIEKVDLLPYHTLGMVKYKQLGLEYPFHCRRSLGAEELKELKEIGDAMGLSVTIGGLRA